MRYSEALGGRAAVVAVIGGGASGTLATTYLLQAAAEARIPLRIALIDRYGRHGLGQAYATANPAHLLNSPVRRMSAFAADPGHLARWAAATGIGPDGFLPRAAYGRYLREVLADAERLAAPAVTVTRTTSDVLGLTSDGLHRPLRLRLAAGRHLDADVVVLATGNRPPAPPCPVPASPRYVSDPWVPGALDGVADGRPVVVLGTGLTMLDVAISVTSAHPETVVRAVSRHALLPREHRCPPARAVQPLILHALDGSPVGLSALIRRIRVAAADAPEGWQAVADALRPHIPALWQRLSPPDKRLFLRHVARYWEVHRHRVPSATASRIDQLRSVGRLSVLPGCVVAVSDKLGGLCVRIEQGGRVTEVAAGWLINATGPAADVTATTDPLLRGLLDSGLARPDPCRLGIEADAGGASCTRAPPFRRSATRPPRWPAGCWSHAARRPHRAWPEARLRSRWDDRHHDRIPII
ncbi:MAG: FAD/NAD(P)-binding protein [Streptosporangiaceae bacterium]